jgi:hypothetical protein
LEKPSRASKIALVATGIVTTVCGEWIAKIADSSYDWFLAQKVPKIETWISNIPPLTLTLFTILFLISIFYSFHCFNAISALVKLLKEKKKNATRTN